MKPAGREAERDAPPPASPDNGETRWKRLTRDEAMAMTGKMASRRRWRVHHDYETREGNVLARGAEVVVLRKVRGSFDVRMAWPCPCCKVMVAARMVPWGVLEVALEV